jgi:alpha-D-ribose 1-methylphosphonate 5-triphosphate synthase subunit PhnG
MSVLTCANTTEIATCLSSIGPVPAHEQLRPPQSGLVMLRGRIGGDGAPFNFGEATVSRAVVRLSSGEIGTGYVLGRDEDKARLIAVCDAMLQSAEHRDRIEHDVLIPMRERLRAVRDTQAQRVAATKVEFFTLVRGG